MNTSTHTVNQSDTPELDKRRSVESIERKTVSSVVAWGVLTGLFLKVGSIATTLILVRLLSPQIYGEYGLVSAVLMFAFTFSMQRFMEHSFHRADGPEESYKDHLGFGILLHLGIFLVFNLICFVLVLPEKYQKVIPYLHLGSLSILLNIPRIYYSTHLRRILDWRRQRLIHVVSFILASSGSIGLALAGYGVVALLAQNLLIPIPYFIDLVWRRPDMLVFRFRLTGYWNASWFGLIRSGNAGLTVGQQLLEASVFLSVVGFAGFGLYGRAIGLGTLAVAWLSNQVCGLMYPILAKVPPSSAQARRAAGLIFRLAVWSSLPLALALALVNNAAVLMLYGSKWNEVAVWLPPTLLSAAVATVTRGMVLVLLTNEGPKKALLVDISLFAIYAIGLGFVLKHSVLAYCWFIAIASIVVLVGLTVRLIAIRALDLSDISAVTKSMLPVVVAAIAATLMPEFDAFEAQHPLLALFGAVVTSSVLAVCAVRFLDTEGAARACAYLPGGEKVATFVGLPIR